MATTSSDAAAGKIYISRSCLIQDILSALERQYITNICTLFAICSQEKWCLIVSRIRCSIWYLGKIRGWERCSIRERITTGMYFYSAPITCICLGKTPSRSCVRRKVKNLTVWARVWNSLSEACDCRNSFKVVISFFTVCGTLLG